MESAAMAARVLRQRCSVRCLQRRIHPESMRCGQRTLQKKLRAVAFERVVSQFAGDDFR
jgi:hypothetical protein